MIHALHSASRPSRRRLAQRLALWFGFVPILLACGRGNDPGAEEPQAETAASDGGMGGSATNEAPEMATELPAVLPEAKVEGGVFVHLFEWRFTDIALECETFLGPNGFAAVQISPPSEHAVLSGHPWWQRYQTVSYDLTQSRSGTELEFREMVARCARAGVAIYVDAVVNHMTGQQSGIGSNSTRFTKYEYPGLYTESDFHVPRCIIEDSDYQNDATRVQNCELLGLSDLDTAAEGVRDRIADYLASLVNLGVRGFRIDAAKHMAPADLDAIIGRVATRVPADRQPYYFLEIFTFGGEAVTVEDYASVGASAGARVDITEFRYSGVGEHFLGRNGKTLAALGTLTETTWGLLPSDRAVVFTNNHDTQRGSAIYYPDGPRHDLANLFLLAWPYGYPAVMSSFAFDRASDSGRSQGPPSDAPGRTALIYSDPSAAPNCAADPWTAAPGTWVCEHRIHSVAGMVKFRKVAATSPVANLWDNGGGQLAFAREGKGFIALNGEAAPLSQSFQTTLPKGSYCDIVAGGLTGGTCSGTTVLVDDAGQAHLEVPALGAVAFHIEARAP